MDAVIQTQIIIAAIYYIFWNWFVIFQMRRKLLFLDAPKFSDQVIFPIRKNRKMIPKKYKFWIANKFLYGE
jgi:hypothetical protein